MHTVHAPEASENPNNINGCSYTTTVTGKGLRDMRAYPLTQTTPQMIERDETENVRETQVVATPQHSATQLPMSRLTISKQSGLTPSSEPSELKKIISSRKDQKHSAAEDILSRVSPSRSSSSQPEFYPLSPSEEGTHMLHAQAIAGIQRENEHPDHSEMTDRKARSNRSTAPVGPRDNCSEMESISKTSLVLTSPVLSPIHVDQRDSYARAGILERDFFARLFFFFHPCSFSYCVKCFCLKYSFLI